MEISPYFISKISKMYQIYELAHYVRNAVISCLGDSGEKTLEDKKDQWMGTSPVVKWLGIHLPMQGTWVQPLAGKLRSHMPWSN